MNSRLTILLATALLLASCATATAPGSDIPDLSRYHTVLIESVRIAPEAGMLSSENRQTLERQLRVALVDSIPLELRSLAPAADVLRIQVTVTELDAGASIDTGAHTTRPGVPLNRGAIEFEVRYFRHGATVPFAMVSEQHKPSHFALSGSFSHYGHAVGALRDWGAGLVGSMPRT